MYPTLIQFTSSEIQEINIPNTYTVSGDYVSWESIVALHKHKQGFEGNKELHHLVITKKNLITGIWTDLSGVSEADNLDLKADNYNDYTSVLQKIC